MATLKSAEMNEFIFGDQVPANLEQLINRFNTDEANLEEWEKLFCIMYESVVWEVSRDFEKTKEIDYQNLPLEFWTEIGTVSDIWKKCRTFFPLQCYHDELLLLVEVYLTLTKRFMAQFISDIEANKKSAILFRIRIRKEKSLREIAELKASLAKEEELYQRLCESVD